MHPPVKDHTDGIGHDEPVLDCSDDKDMARQEYKNEADIAYMLSKFGVIQPRGAPTYGEWDDSIDLLSAITSVADAREAYQRVPEELRAKFTSMEQLLEAVQNGSLKLVDAEAPPEQKTELQLLREELDALKSTPSGSTTTTTEATP